MISPNANRSRLELLGKFLGEAYVQDQDVERLKILLTGIAEDWNANLEFAYENRVHTNLIATITKTPGLSSTLPDNLKNEIKKKYFQIWHRSELIKRQLLQISNQLEKSKQRPLVLIKGGIRIFDGLYNNPDHRYMSDLDLYFDNASVLQELSEIGYRAAREGELDLPDADQAYLDWHKSQSHHLPPIRSDKHPCNLEMHQHFVHLRAASLCRENLAEDSIAIPQLPGINRPSPVDELILNLLHTKYGDRFTYYANFRLRNILEGYLLYRRLTKEEIQQFQRHFETIGKKNDVAFWKLLCFKLLGVEEFDIKYSLHLKLQYHYHMRFGQQPKINAAIYGIYFVYRLVTRELWTKSGRKRFQKKLLNGDIRQKFLARIRGRW